MFEQWSYYVEEIVKPPGYSNFRMTEVTEQLNNLGRLNWELVSVVQTEPGVLLAFLKQKVTL